MSGFAHAPVTKAWMIQICAMSFLSGAFARKYYFDVPLVPHLSRDHQLWRLAAHHLAFANSSELLVAVILIYSLSPTLERTFGSHKYASFLFLAALLSSTFELLALLTCYRLGFTTVPAGPFGLLGALVYQYYRLIPSAYTFRIAGITLTNKAFTYFLAAQLCFSQPFLSAVPSLCGFLAGAIYRSDLVNLRAYRLPRPLVRLARRTLGPALTNSSASRSQRRLNHASLDDVPTPQGFASAFAGVATNNPTTTAVHRLRPQTAGTGAGPPAAGPVEPQTRPAALREWAETFTGTAQARAPPPPTADQVASLQAMFPAATSEAITAALTSNGNDVNRAVERLLTAG